MNELTLSRNTAQCTSSWEGKYITGGAFEYTAPSWDYDNITITVPAEMTGAVFRSVNISYYHVSKSGSESIRFSDTRVEVTNAGLLSRLQNGETEISILFAFRASGGSGGSGSHSVTSYWSDFSVEVDWIPAAKVHGELSVGSSFVNYAIDKNSIAPGESSDITLSVQADADYTGIRMELCVDGNAVYTYERAAVISSGKTTIVRDSIHFRADGLTKRVNAASIRITLLGSTNVTGSLTATSLKLLIARLAPQVALNLSDTAGAYNLTGAFVQGQSVLSGAMSVTLDTAADEDISITSRTLDIGGHSYSSGNDTFTEIDSAALSGSVPWTLTVKDSYGITGSASGTVEISPYTAPSINSLSFERYAEKTSSTGEMYYEPDDGSNMVRVSMSAYVSAINSKNAWTLTASYGDGLSHTMASGDDGAAIDYEEERTIFTVLLSPTEQWDITVSLSDLFSSSTAVVSIPKAGGIFSIERGGVAVGKRVTGTPEAPLFECACPAVFEAGITDAAGNSIGSVDYVLPETRIGTYLGKALYRKGVELSSFPTSATEIDVGISAAHVTKIEGYVMSNSYGELPINCYHSSSIRVFCRYDTTSGKLVGYTGSANKGAVIFVEYTKE